MLSLSKVIEEYNKILHTKCGYQIPEALKFGNLYSGTAWMNKLNLSTMERRHYENRRTNKWVIIGSFDKRATLHIDPNMYIIKVFILQSESQRNKRIRDLIANPSLEIFDYLREKNILPCVTDYNILGYRAPRFKYVVNT